MEWQIVVLVGIVVLFLLGIRLTGAIRQATSAEAISGIKDEARSILENRYALGEIDDEEFARRLEVLRDARKRSRQRRYESAD